MNNPHANNIWKAIAGVMQVAAPFLGVLAAGFAVVYAGYSIYVLFIEHIHARPPEAILAIAASVGVLVTVATVGLTSEHKPTRALASMFAFLWALMVLCMVSLSAALSSDLFATFEALVGIGQVVAAGLAGLALIPALLIPASMQHPDTYKTTGAAAGHYLGLFGKAAVIGTTIFATAYFGISRKVPLPVTILCAVLLETSFLWSYTQLIKARESRDRFDVRVWSSALVLFGVFMALVSVETLSTLGKIDVPLLAPFRAVGAVVFVSAAGLSLCLTVVAHLATTMIDMRDPVDGEAPQIRVGRRNLPAQAPVPQLNQNGPTMPELAGKTQKQAETGQRYDDTGVIVMDDAVEQLRARAKAERERVLSWAKEDTSPKS